MVPVAFMLLTGTANTPPDLDGGARQVQPVGARRRQPGHVGQTRAGRDGAGMRPDHDPPCTSGEPGIDSGLVILRGEGCSGFGALPNPSIATRRARGELPRCASRFLRKHGTIEHHAVVGCSRLEAIVAYRIGGLFQRVVSTSGYSYLPRRAYWQLPLFVCTTAGRSSPHAPARAKPVAPQRPAWISLSVALIAAIMRFDLARLPSSLAI